MRLSAESDIRPDQYNFLSHYDGEEVTYHIFASWKGGYTTGDCWRRSSPIVHVAETDDSYVCETQSGSEYILHKNGRSATGYNMGVLQNLLDLHDGLSIISTQKFLEGVWNNDQD